MPEHSAIALIGLDWGTTSLRAHALSPAGEVIDRRERPWGIRQLAAAEVEAVAVCGARLVVSPNTDPAVIRAAKGAGLATAPGVATPTEAFAAIAAGADLLKLFPAETLGPATVKAWRAVLPAGTPLVPVGGVTPENVPAWRAAGAAGLGLGSAIYAPEMPVPEVARRAQAFVAAWRAAGTA